MKEETYSNVKSLIRPLPEDDTLQTWVGHEHTRLFFYQPIFIECCNGLFNLTHILT